MLSCTRASLSVVLGATPKSERRLNRAIDSFDREVDRLWRGCISPPEPLEDWLEC